MAGHAAAHYYYKYGPLGDLSINQNGGLTHATLNSFCRQNKWGVWYPPPDDHSILLVTIAGPLVEAKFNKINLDEQALIKKAESDPESCEAQIQKLLRGAPLEKLAGKLEKLAGKIWSKLWVYSRRIEKLAVTLIDRPVPASEAKRILWPS